jgi:hypothetical protein
MLCNPIGLGLGVKSIHRYLGTYRAHQQGLHCTQLGLAMDLPLVEPTYSGAQWLAICTHGHHCGSLSGDGHGPDRFPGNLKLIPELMAGLTESLPKILGMLFCPAWLGRKVGLDLDFTLGHQLAIPIKDHSADTLGAVIDRE